MKPEDQLEIKWVGQTLEPENMVRGSEDSVVTLGESREEMYEHLERDREVCCPCCDRFIKIYKRKLNSGMARIICWMVANYKFKEWIDINREAPRFVLQSNEVSRLAHWGLVEQKDNTDDDKRTSGIWRITSEGGAFAFNQHPVPSHVYLLDNVVKGWSEERVYVVTALGDKFSYSELMRGRI